MPAADPSTVEEIARLFLEGQVGGAAVAVLAEGREQIVTLGETRAGSGGAITEATPFHICSCSKAFAAAAFGRLVEENLANWDHRVADVVPEFRLSDPEADRKATFRDLACMRVGLGGDGIAEWGFDQHAPVARRLERAVAMPFAAPFRQGFAYSNLCAIALATACGRLASQPYAHWLDAALLGPLALQDSWSDGTDAAPRRQRAEPHMQVGERWVAVPELTGPNSEGSARVHLSPRDALRWMALFLAGDRGGSAVLRRETIALLLSPATPLESSGRFDPDGSGSAAYGYCWSLAGFRGRRIARSGGGGRGWRHMIALCPEARIGIAVFAAHEGPRVEALTLALLDHLLGAPARDWIAVVEDRLGSEAAAARARVEAAYPASGGASAPSSAIAGLYANALTGRIRIEARGETLHFSAQDAPLFNARLVPLGGATYRFEFDNPALAPTDHDPPFRARFVAEDGEAGFDATYFGRFRRRGP